MKTKIYEIVRKHFPENEYALLQEVRNAAGFSASRSADYLLMNLWPSRGLSVHGIEQKSHRGDWLSELKKPEKAEAIFKYCDYWWLLTTTEGVAKIDEIPEKWGWKQISNGKIKTMKEAPKLNPIPLDRGIIASMLKRAGDKSNFIHKDDIADALRQEREAGENSKNHRLKKVEEDLAQIRINIRDFQEHSGIYLGDTESWRRPDYKKIGDAVKFISNNGTDKVVEQIQRMLSNIRNISESLERDLTLIQS